MFVEDLKIIINRKTECRRMETVGVDWKQPEVRWGGWISGEVQVFRWRTTGCSFDASCFIFFFGPSCEWRRFGSQTEAHPVSGARTDFSASGARRKRKKGEKSKQRPLEADSFSLGRDFSKKGWGGHKSLLSGSGRRFFPTWMLRELLLFLGMGSTFRVHTCWAP